MAKCSPDELKKLHTLISDGKVGETSHRSIVENPSLTSNAGEGEARKRMPLGFSIRPFRHAMGPDLGPRAVDPTWRMSVIIGNTYNRHAKQVIDILKEEGVKITPENDTLLYNVMEHIDTKGRYVGQAQTFPPEIIAAGQRIRPIYNELAAKFGIDGDRFLNYYVPRRKIKPQGLLHDEQEEAFRASLQSQDELKFYHELERKGTLHDYDRRFLSTFDIYLRTGLNTKFMKPHLDKIDHEVVNPFFNTTLVRDSQGQRHLMVDNRALYNKWREYKHNLLGGVTQGDVTQAEQLRTLASYAGHEMTDRESLHALYKWSQIGQSLFYSGAIGSPFGGRPASTLRHMYRLINSWAEFGEKHIAVGLGKAFDKENVARLEGMGLLGSPIEKLIEQTDIASKAGRVISKTSDVFLKVFSGVDKWMRATTALAAESKFNQFESEGKLMQLSMRKGGMREEFQKLVGEGKIDEARQRYMLEGVLNLEYGFGRANKPEAFRGALGSVLGMFTTYPLNTFELYRMFGQRAREAVVDKIKGRPTQGDVMPLLRMIVGASTLMYAGKEFFNTDLSHSIFHGAFSVGLPAAQTVIETGKAVKSNAEYLFSNVYGVGETDFHKMKRQEANRNFARSYSPFVPGGVFFFNDIPKLIDRGSFKEFMGFEPLADERNEMARERARERREQNR